jgi:H+/gluconate symporter-like permease
MGEVTHPLTVLFAVAFIVIATSVLEWHPFIVLLMASYGIGFGADGHRR